jgi:hypothetical protein
MSKKATSNEILTPEDESIQSLVNFECPKPFDVLGPQNTGKKSITVRVFLPDDEKVWIIPKDKYEDEKY